MTTFSERWGTGQPKPGQPGSDKPLTRRKARKRTDIDLSDLIDVTEDILEELEAVRGDIRPVIWLAWINLIFLAVVVVVAVIIVAAAAGEGG